MFREQTPEHLPGAARGLSLENWVLRQIAEAVERSPFRPKKSILGEIARLVRIFPDHIVNYFAVHRTGDFAEAWTGQTPLITTSDRPITPQPAPWPTPWQKDPQSDAKKTGSAHDPVTVALFKGLARIAPNILVTVRVVYVQGGIDNA
jgi:hypothetical protein